MKPTLIQVPSYDNLSFRVSHEEVSYFYNPLHYHDELELTLIVKGTGTRFIGDHIEPFKSGDLILVGPNLAHCWKNDSQYFEADSKLIAESIVVQFTENFAGNSFFELPELFAINAIPLTSSFIIFSLKRINLTSNNL